MDTPITSFRAVVELWKNRADFAREVGEDYENARQWWLNDSIPGRAFSAVVQAASARGFPVTHEMLCGFAAQKHEQRKAQAASA